MKISTKILIVLGSILTLGLLGIIVYQQFQMKNQQSQIESQVIKQKELSDQLVRSQSQFATSKDVENFIKNNGLPLTEIQKDLGKLHAEVNSVNQVIIGSRGQIAVNLPSTNTSGPKNPTPPEQIKCSDGTLCPNPDPFGFMKNQQNLTLSENFGNTQVPIGSIGFSSWQKDPWSTNILPRTYTITSVVGLDENQRQIFYNKVRVRVDGKDYDVAISKAETQQMVLTSKFSFWNPRLFIGIDGGISFGTNFRGDFVPNFDIGIMSLGKFRNQADWSFLQLGMGYGVFAKNVEFILTPFAYNIGQHIPLMNNTYLGPSLMLSPSGTFSTMIGLRVGL